MAQPKRRRRLLAVLGISLIVVLGGTLWWLRGQRFEFVITQSRIDQTLSTTFPKSKRILRIIEVQYSDPEVTLLPEADRIRVAIRVTIPVQAGDAQAEPVSGHVTATTGLRFEGSTHAFHLTDPVLDSLEIDGIPSQWTGPVTKVTTEFLQSILEKTPVYVLQPKDAKRAAARALLKEFDVRDQEIHVVIGI